MYSRVQRAVVRHTEPNEGIVSPEAVSPAFRGRLLIEIAIGVLLIACVVGGVFLFDNLLLATMPEMLAGK